MSNFLKNYYKKILGIVTGHVFFRYVFSGGTSAAVDLSVLYSLNSIARMEYLVSAIIAFIVAFGVSFTLHKFWTFRTKLVHDTRKQVALYLMTSLVGLSLNTLLMYVSVSHLHIAVLLSQVFVGLMVACCTFFLSRNLVFKWHLNQPL
jgi:putative flippase GtrA